ncbi:unnamed protein product [Brassica oleracea]
MQAGSEGKVQDLHITRYSVKVVPVSWRSITRCPFYYLLCLVVETMHYNYDMSPYGFREFFKRQGVRTSDPK